MKSQVLHTVWCYISGEAAGEIWHWSPSKSPVGDQGPTLRGGRVKGLLSYPAGLFRIKKMFPGQPAATCGKLQIGDIVLEVNGQSLEGKTHQEAINLVRMGPHDVTLLVKRDPSSIPQSLLQRAGSNASDIDPAQLLADIQSRLRDDRSARELASFKARLHMQFSMRCWCDLRTKPAPGYPAWVFSRVTLRQNTSKLTEIGLKGVFK